MGRYADALPVVVPPWLQGPKGRDFLAAIGEMLDTVADDAVAATHVRLPTLAPADALPALAWERRTVRFYGELESAFRGRLARSHDVWALSGSRSGVSALAQAMGFTYADAWPCRELGRWSEVDVYLYGRALAPGEGPTLYQVIAQFLPGHARLRVLFYGILDVWQDDGLWQTNDVYWGGGELIPT